MYRMATAAGGPTVAGVQSATIALISFACIFGGSLLGMWLGARLPPHQVDKRTQDLVKLGMGTIATLMALVLGLMVATAKASFDTTATQTKEFAAKMIQLDRLLVRYGPETTSTRQLLRGFLALKIDEVWGHHARRAYTPATNGGDLLDLAGDELLALAPADENHRALKARALQLGGDLGQLRWLVVEHAAGSAIPTPFLVVLVFWATVLFVSFGLFAPRHATAIAMLFVCALSIAGAIFLILELSHPFNGLMRIPSGPARTALANMR
jgi:hypothetical protein